MLSPLSGFSGHDPLPTTAVSVSSAQPSPEFAQIHDARLLLEPMQDGRSPMMAALRTGSPADVRHVLDLMDTALDTGRLRGEEAWAILTAVNRHGEPPLALMTGTESVVGDKLSLLLNAAHEWAERRHLDRGAVVDLLALPCGHGPDPGPTAHALTFGRFSEHDGGRAVLSQFKILLDTRRIDAEQALMLLMGAPAQRSSFALQALEGTQPERLPQHAARVQQAIHARLLRPEEVVRCWSLKPDNQQPLTPRSPLEAAMQRRNNTAEDAVFDTYVDLMIETLRTAKPGSLREDLLQRAGALVSDLIASGDAGNVRRYMNRLLQEAHSLDRQTMLRLAGLERPARTMWRPGAAAETSTSQDDAAAAVRDAWQAWHDGLQPLSNRLRPPRPWADDNDELASSRKRKFAQALPT